MDEQSASDSEDIDDEADNDPKFEDGDIDALEDEDIFDENGKKITVDELSIEMKDIFERHMQRLQQIGLKYEAIEKEARRESVEDDGWESEGGWETEGGNKDE